MGAEIVADLVGESDWDSLARNSLRAELMRHGMSYARLVDALAELGVEETEASIKNKVSRGRFPFVFFLQAMTAIGAEWIQVPSLAALKRGDGVGEHWDRQATPVAIAGRVHRVDDQSRAPGGGGDIGRRHGVALGPFDRHVDA